MLGLAMKFVIAEVS